MRLCVSVSDTFYEKPKINDTIVKMMIPIDKMYFFMLSTLVYILYARKLEKVGFTPNYPFEGVDLHADRGM